MRRFGILASVAALMTSTLAFAAPGDRMPDKNGYPNKARPAPQSAPQGRPSPQSMPQARPANMDRSRPATGDRSAPKNFQRPEMPTYGARPTPVAADKHQGNNRPNNYNNRPNNNYNNGYNNNRPGTNGNRPNGGNNNFVTGNTVVVPGNNRYPVYRPPNGGYYRPPNGGYYGPPRPPPGGWHGGYYPPPRYYYDDGPSVGDVIAGVAVTGTLLYVLSEASKPKQQTVVVQGGPPPMPPQYVPPRNSTGAPASINVDLGGLTPEARPTASVCLTEAARQIGATGGTEIRIDRIVEVEKGNGGYRFRLDLLGVYPDETRNIPMYCRATPEKIVELTFG